MLTAQAEAVAFPNMQRTHASREARVSDRAAPVFEDHFQAEKSASSARRLLDDGDVEGDERGYSLDVIV